jgi:hypothetical protein
MKNQSSIHLKNYLLGFVMKCPKLYQSWLMEMRYYPLNPYDFFLMVAVQKLDVHEDSDVKPNSNVKPTKRIPKVVKR